MVGSRLTERFGVDSLIRSRKYGFTIGVVIIFLVIVSVLVNRILVKPDKTEKQNEAVAFIDQTIVKGERNIGTPGKKLIFEAEEALLTGLTVGEDQSASGGKFVEGFDAAGDTLRFVFEHEEPGTYMLIIRYRTFGGDKLNFIHMNGEPLAEFTFRQSSVWNDALVGQYEIKAGENSIEIVSSWGWIAVDHLTLIGGPSGPVTAVDLRTEGGEASGPADMPVVLQALADHAAEYRFSLKAKSGDWELIRDYEETNNAIWLPTGVGNFEFRVQARGLASEAAFEAEAIISYETLPEYANKPLLSSVFRDHMVLQRDQEVVLWGWSEPNSEVKVAIGEQVYATITSEHGRWELTIGKHAAGGPYTIAVTSDNQSKTITDVLFGDVWLASGQSNMEWTLSQAMNAVEEIAAADYPNIRFIGFPSRPSPVPVSVIDEAHSWKAVTPSTASELSAVAYFFARKITEETDIPIGIIFAAVGGTRIEPWISYEKLQEHPKYAASSHRIRIGAERMDTFNSPNIMYNGMIAPITPYAIKGVLWYQGESNGGDPGYHKLLPMMMEDWRNAFHNDQLPFIIVQLASYGSQQSDNDPVQVYGGFPIVRDAQLQTVLRDEHACLVVTTDVGDPADIHPTNKQDVGLRSALCALGTIYGQSITYSGPIYQTHRIDGEQIRISFDHVGLGLMAGEKQGLDPVIPLSQHELQGFGIAGEDGTFYPAKALIDGNDVVVSSEHVSQPMHVRYGWYDSSIGNLYNKDGLPASPFRTDRKTILDVVEGTGAGSYVPGTVVEVIGYLPKEGTVFERWVGDIEHLADPNSRKTTITIPDLPYLILAPQYRPE